MDFEHLWVMCLIPAACGLLWWSTRRSVHPMSRGRRRTLLVLRCIAAALALAALAGPALKTTTNREAVIFIVDRSASLGAGGVDQAYAAAAQLAASLPQDTPVGLVSIARSVDVPRMPGTEPWDAARITLASGSNLTDMSADASDTDLAAGVELARGLFPPGVARRIVLISDGLETTGNVQAAARRAASGQVRIDALPLAGEARPDIRVIAVRPSKTRLHQGAQLALHADLEGSIPGEVRVRLFENGIEVEHQDVDLAVGKVRTVTFDRSPKQKDLYRYEVRVDTPPQDAIAENNTGMAMVDVEGLPVLLFIEGEEGESRYLEEAMAREGILLVTRPVQGLPDSLEQLAGFDGVVLSDVPARLLKAQQMQVIRDYVEAYGGGFVMIGGPNSFGVGGYYRTPIEDILPVRMKAPDKEQKFATALMLVVDRSGSMSGQKIELCKSAAIAAVEVLQSKDYIGVVAFDSSAQWVVPITRVESPETIASQIGSLTAGGGTNLMPGMQAGRQALASVNAKVKHMIVLTDGQTSGSGYEQMAAAMLAEGITVSSVGVGAGADIGLLQRIAQAGNGQFYATVDPTTLPQIFTQDTMRHTGRLLREAPFIPQRVERHPMVNGWPADQAPALTGYVKTRPKSTAQIPLVTDLGEPLLATWRFGLGKVTAFTSDAKSRWAALWISSWRDGYSQFWAQVLRETARNTDGWDMDLRLERDGDDVVVSVDVLETAASFRNDAQVHVRVQSLAADQLASNDRRTSQLTLEQVGPGRYEGRFPAETAGVYLVRAEESGRSVSAGFVKAYSGEAATGQINTRLLTAITTATGGTLLESNASALPDYTAPSLARFHPLRPWLLMLLLLVFLADTAVRRWENIIGLRDAFLRRN